MQNNNWYKALHDKVNALTSQFGLNEQQGQILRDFVIQLSRSQYKVGSKSGAGWAFGEARKKIAAGQPV